MIALLATWLLASPTCAQWEKANDIQLKERFFVAIQSGTSIPTEYGGRDLGICASGTCTITPAGCGFSVIYTYNVGPLIGGWRIAEVFTHPYIAKGWKLAAAEAGIRWYKDPKDVVTECLVHFTGAQCLDLLDADNRCWLLDDGNYCRYGNEYGPALGGSAACRYARVQAPMACSVYRGAGSERTDATKEVAEAEFDKL